MAYPQVECATPGEQGLDSGVLAASEKRINDNYPNIYSLLVVRHGYMVYEKYYQGMDGNRYNPVYSVTKSVMSALTGIAMYQKLLKGPEQKLSDLLPQYFTDRNEPDKASITIDNVLTMTSGLDSVDTNYGAFFSSRDWMDYAIKKPMKDKPGEKFSYNTGVPQFLSGAIAEASNMTTKDFAQTNLFTPMGILVQRWDADSTGVNGGGAGLYLTPSEMAKFGLLYLKNGAWDGKQIIPKEWVQQSVKQQVRFQDVRGYGYGYMFWVQTFKSNTTGKSYPSFFASGAGGQYIVIVLDLDLVAVVTANLPVLFFG